MMTKFKRPDLFRLRTGSDKAVSAATHVSRVVSGQAVPANNTESSVRPMAEPEIHTVPEVHPSASESTGAVDVVGISTNVQTDLEQADSIGSHSTSLPSQSPLNNNIPALSFSARRTSVVSSSSTLYSPTTPPNGTSESFCDLPTLGVSQKYENSIASRTGTSSTTNSMHRLSGLPSDFPSSSSSKHANALNARDSRSFDTLGYLVPPHPANELDRRTALHRFNLLFTEADVNFDRVAHLAKLMFRTRWAYITLVNAHDIYVKHNSGSPPMIADRDTSMCGHTILQNQPMVVLDPALDWRFAQNPLIGGDESIKFYAGAQLRTADGYNVGTLCVVDDQHRAEFSIKEQHMLQEFATIVMREMELWRDKIQLRFRDRIQTSCLEFAFKPGAPAEQSLETIFASAALLVRTTLDLDAAMLADISTFQLVDSTSATPSSPSSDGTSGAQKMYHGDPFVPRDQASDSTLKGDQDSRHEYGPLPAFNVLGCSDGANVERHIELDPLSGQAHEEMAIFLADHPNGKVYKRSDAGAVPSCFDSIVPKNVEYAMIVPIFGVEGQPFALLCGCTTEGTKHYLEGFEIQYLRAIGVIILSAVLKRRMKMADKAKSLFISNISHELRTPLHGILAAAELMKESQLTDSQESFLRTVESCAASLSETVNHVLDFSKLSGKSDKNASVKRSAVDLVSLLEETVEGACVGAQIHGTYGSAYIGSAYSPPKGKDSPTSSVPEVETVLDIGLRDPNWELTCEKVGIRRILMNLMGNSIKFTSTGFVHVSLREVLSGPDPSIMKVELVVSDSGKGISEEYLNNRIFQPFSQENPMQTGTGLGLAIVNAIVKSPGMNGKVDVFSTENIGTAIRIIFDGETPSAKELSVMDRPAKSLKLASHTSAKVCLVGFDSSHTGQHLLAEVLSSYLVDWWDATLADTHSSSNILLLNEDIDVLVDLMNEHQMSRPIILLTSHRGDKTIASIITSFEEMGGHCFVVDKPCRPSHLLGALEKAVTHLAPPRLLARSSSSSLLTPRLTPLTPLPGRPSTPLKPSSDDYFGMSHRSGEDNQRKRSHTTPAPPQRPPLNGPVKFADHVALYESKRPSILGDGRLLRQRLLPPVTEVDAQVGCSRTSILPATRPATKRVISSADDEILPNVRSGLMSKEGSHVMIVDDNHVNRALLAQWFRKKKIAFDEAADGQQAVDLFKSHPSGYYDVILMDITMPILDGCGATEAIRAVEAERDGDNGGQEFSPRMSRASSVSGRRTKVFAVSGLATGEDKVRAFNAGVDGYIVKPVSFKSLSTLLLRREDEPGA